MLHRCTCTALPAGPVDYMLGCVQPNDFVADLKSDAPTRVPGSKCDAMGYTYQGMDGIYTRVKLYWKNGR